MAFASNITLDDARKFGADWWELVLTNWGNRGAAADINSLQFPILPTQADLTIPSVQGIAISPLSDVDRCRVQYVQPGGPSVTPVADPQVVQANEVIVTADRPMMGFTPGPIVIKALRDSYFLDSYIPDGSTSGATFGTALPSTVFSAPALRLFLFLNEQTTIPQVSPGGRLPRTILLSETFLGGEGDTLAQVIPVMGRRRIRVIIRASGAVDLAVRVTGVTESLFGTAPGPLIFRGGESPLGSDPSVAGATGDQVTFNFDHPQQQFLLVYWDNSAGGAGGANIVAEAADR